MISNADMLAITRQLPIPVPWNRNKLIESLAHQRGRNIRLIPADTSAFTNGPCGLWLILDDEDVIIHETGTSEYHVDQIVCHEIGHMILGHGTPVHNSGNEITGYAKLCATLLPGFDPDRIRTVLGRRNYISDQERDAETFASILMLTAAEVNDSSPMMRNAFFRRR